VKGDDFAVLYTYEHGQGDQKEERKGDEPTREERGGTTPVGSRGRRNTCLVQNNICAEKAKEGEERKSTRSVQTRRDRNQKKKEGGRRRERSDKGERCRTGNRILGFEATFSKKRRRRRKSLSVIEGRKRALSIPRGK